MTPPRNPDLARSGRPTRRRPGVSRPISTPRWSRPTWAAQIYAQLDTGTASGSNAVDWFILRPTLAPPALTVGVAHQGVVAVKNVSLLYPYTAVNANGVGYLLFSLSGRNNYPSPAYITYNVDGPTGSVIEATAGVRP